MLTEDQKRSFLKRIPGSKLTADGVAISGEGFQFFINNFYEDDGDFTVDESFFRAFCNKSEILRLREISNADDYLLKLRAEAIVDSPRQVRVFNKRKKLFNSSKCDWSQTRYYNSLNKVPKRYLGRLPIKLQKKAKRIPYGFVQNTEVNAMCYRTLVGEIILVSESLRHFFYFMTIFFYGENFNISTQDCVAAGHIAVRLMMGSETLDFDIDPRGKLPTKVNALIQHNVDSMIEFTFAHEFSHFLLGHMEEPNDTNQTSPIGDLRTYNHRLEYEADISAVKLIIGKVVQSRLYFAGLQIFTYFQFLEEFGKIYAGFNSSSVSTTHPTPLSRIENLKQSLKFPRSKKHIFGLAREENIKDLASFLVETINSSGRDDFLTVLGSVYMGGLGGKIRRDRFDF